MRSIHSLAGRADLVRVLGAQGEPGLVTLAEMLGYGGKCVGPKSAVSHSGQGTVPQPRHPVKTDIATTPSLRVAKVEYFDEQKVPEALPVKNLDLNPTRKKGQPSAPPLVAWPRLWRTLEDIFRAPKRTMQLDVTVLVNELAHGRVVQHLPRRFVPSICRVRLVLDRSARLMPFWGDQIALALELRRRLGPYDLDLGVIPASNPERIEPEPGLLLVTSDLGLLGDAGVIASWRAAGERLKRAGVLLRALLPCPRTRWLPQLARLWNAIEWEKPAFQAVALLPQAKGELEKRRDEVLQLLSMAIRIEPGLLREIRRLVEKADAGTEADVWATFPNPSAVAATPSLKIEDRQGEGSVEDGLKRVVYSRIRRWHAMLPPLVLAEETLTPFAQGATEPAQEREAKEYLRAACAVVREIGTSKMPFLVDWFREWAGRIPGPTADPVLARDMVTTWSALYSRDASLPLPSWVSPALLSTLEAGKILREFSIWQTGNKIELSLREAGRPASPLGVIRVSGSRIVVVGAQATPFELSVDAPELAFELVEVSRILRLVSNLEAVEFQLEKALPEAKSPEAAEGFEPTPVHTAAALKTGSRQPENDKHEIRERAEDSGGVSEVPPVDISQLSEEMVALVAAMEGKNPIEGKVIGWNKGGYHVAIGKIAAFCPVSQMEIGNPRSPKKYLDKPFMFHVMEIQQNGRRVVVSRQGVIRKEREAAAAKVRENVKVGAELQGRVSSITDFGAFVDLGGGVEGLVHVSELSRRRVEHAKELVQVGQTVKVAVLKVEKNGKRISLSMKKLEQDPWDALPETLQPGSEFEGKVMRKSEFGLFIEVLPGVEGLAHTSRLQLGTTLADAAYEPGSPVKGWVQEIDKKRRRLSLSLREIATSNPWKGISDRYPEGQMVTGKVEKLTNFGVFIELEPGLTGLLAFAQLNGPGNPKRAYQVGRDVSVRVLSIDRDKKRISLGTEQSRAEGGQSDFRDYVRQKREATGMGALARALAKARESVS